MTWASEQASLLTARLMSEQADSLGFMRAIAAPCVAIVPRFEVVALASGGGEQFAGEAQGGLPRILVRSELVQQDGRSGLCLRPLGLLALGLVAFQAGSAV